MRIENIFDLKNLRIFKTGKTRIRISAEVLAISNKDWENENSEIHVVKHLEKLLRVIPNEKYIIFSDSVQSK